MCRCVAVWELGGAFLFVWCRRSRQKRGLRHARAWSGLSVRSAAQLSCSNCRFAPQRNGRGRRQAHRTRAAHLEASAAPETVRVIRGTDRRVTQHHTTSRGRGLECVLQRRHSERRRRRRFTNLSGVPRTKGAPQRTQHVRCTPPTPSSATKLPTNDGAHQQQRRTKGGTKGGTKEGTKERRNEGTNKQTPTQRTEQKCREKGHKTNTERTNERTQAALTHSHSLTEASSSFSRRASSTVNDSD